jgi:putative oxidoreductase
MIGWLKASDEVLPQQAESGLVGDPGVAPGAIPLLAVPDRFYTTAPLQFCGLGKSAMDTQTKSVSRPETLDAGLLMLRIGAGFSLFALFGLAKVKSAFAFTVHHQPWIFIEFLRRLGFPFPTVAAFVQTLNESLGALFVLIGFYTRVAAAFLAVGFAVATYCSARIAEPSVFMAACYCLMFLVLSLTGPGKISIDDLRASALAIRAKA